MGVTRCWFFPPLETPPSLLPMEHLSSVLLPWSIIGKRRWRNVWATTNWESISIMAQTGINVQKCKCRNIEVTRLKRPHWLCLLSLRFHLISTNDIVKTKGTLIPKQPSPVLRDNSWEKMVFFCYILVTLQKKLPCEQTWFAWVVSQAAAAFPGRRGSVTGISWWWISHSKFTFFFC